MGLNSVVNCVESAMAIISIVYSMSSGSSWRRELLGAWNYSLYYTFNAALVIFGSLVVASKERDRNPSAWTMVSHSRPYIDTAAEALRQLDSGNPVVERCQEYLSQLSVILDPLISEEPYFDNRLAFQFPTEYSSGLFPFHGSDLVPPMDLGEFMIGQDWDLLGRMLGQPHSEK